MWAVRCFSALLLALLENQLFTSYALWAAFVNHKTYIFVKSYLKYHAPGTSQTVLASGPVCARGKNLCALLLHLVTDTAVARERTDTTDTDTTDFLPSIQLIDNKGLTIVFIKTSPVLLFQLYQLYHCIRICRCPKAFDPGDSFALRTFAGGVNVHTCHFVG